MISNKLTSQQNYQILLSLCLSANCSNMLARKAAGRKKIRQADFSQQKSSKKQKQKQVKSMEKLLPKEEQQVKDSIEMKPVQSLRFKFARKKLPAPLSEDEPINPFEYWEELAERSAQKDTKIFETPQLESQIKRAYIQWKIQYSAEFQERRNSKPSHLSKHFSQK